MGNTLPPVIAVASAAIASAASAFGAPLALGAFATVGSGAFVFGGSAIISTIATIGVSLGLQFAASALFRPSTPSVPRPSDGRLTFRQELPPRAVVLGRVRDGGGQSEILGPEAQDGILYRLPYVSQGPTRGPLKWFVDSREVELDGDGYVVSDDVIPDRFLRIEHRVGQETETAYQTVINALGSEIWTEDHRGDTCASFLYSVMSPRPDVYREYFPNGQPIIEAIWDGVLCYDFNSGAEYNDTSQWTWSRNPARLLLWFLTSQYGMKLDYERFFAPAFEVWRQAANDCDELVLRADGTEIARYTVGLKYTLSNAPSEIIEALLASMDASWQFTPDGRGVGVRAGKYSPPTIRLNRKDELSSQVEFGLAETDVVDEIRANFISPAQDFREAEAEPWAEFFSIDNNVRPLDLYFVHEHNQVRRLTKKAFLRANAQFRGQKTFKPRGLLALDEPYVEVYVPGLGYRSARVTKRSVSWENLTLSIEFIAEGPEISEFDPLTEEGQEGQSAASVVQNAIPEPENVDIDVIARSVTGTQSGVIIQASVDSPEREDLFLAMRYRVKAAEGEEPKQWMETAVPQPEDLGDRFSIESGFVEAGATYEVQVRLQSASGRGSQYTQLEEIDAVSDNLPPDPVQSPSFDVINTGPLTTDVSISWISPNSANFEEARVYRNSVNDFDTSTTLASIFGAPSSFQQYLDEDVDIGSQYYWIVPFNGSEIPGPRVSSGEIII